MIPTWLAYSFFVSFKAACLKWALLRFTKQSHQVISILSNIHGDKIVPQASQMFSWVLTEHSDYKVAIFLYTRYIKIIKNAKIKTDAAVLRLGVQICLYQLHKLLDMTD